MDTGILEKKAFKPQTKPGGTSPRIISRVINKPKAKTEVPPNWEDEDDLDIEMDDDVLTTEVDVDLDNYSEEDLD